MGQLKGFVRSDTVLRQGLCGRSDLFRCKNVGRRRSFLHDTASVHSEEEFGKSFAVFNFIRANDVE